MSRTGGDAGGRVHRGCSWATIVLGLPIALMAIPLSAARGDDRADDGTIGIEIDDGEDVDIETLISEIEELIVTARRREETVLDTPVAVTSIGNSVLTDQDLRSLTDIGNFVPGLQIKQTLTGSPSIFIRGIGQRDSIPDFDPGVAVYMDGAYLARADGSLLANIDVDRIEVLRGPQGTLYGKNAVGGAINFITRKPGPDFEASAEIRGGNFKTYDGRLTVNIPIVDDKLYSRFSLAAAHSQGFMTNLRDDTKWGNNKLYSFAGAIRLLPTDSVTIDVSGRWSREWEKPRGLGCIVSSGGGLAAGIDRARFVFNGLGSIPLPPGGGSLPLDPFLQDSFSSACRGSGPVRDLKFESELFGKYHLDSSGLAMTAAWEAPTFGRLNALELKSITSFQRQSLNYDSDIDGSGFELIANETVEDRIQNQVSQEFQANGSAFDEKLTYALGLYGFWEYTERGGLRSKFGPDNGVWYPCGFLGLGPLQGCFDVGPIPGASYGVDISSDDITVGEIDNASYAVYGQTSYQAWDWLELTAGLRFTYETKGLDRTIDYIKNVNPLIQGTKPSISVERSFSRWSPMGSVRLIPPDEWLDKVYLDNANLYFSYSQGFKSGGFSSRNDPRTGEPAEFEQEVVNAYELGFKLSAWSGRFYLTTALFWNDYTDMQLTIAGIDGVTNRPAPTIDNAGQAVVRGLEIETQVRPVDHLTLRGNLALSDAFYEEFFDEGAPQAPVDLRDRSGEKFFNLPDLDLTLSAEYDLVLDELGLPDWGTLTPGIDTNYKSTIHYQFTPGGFRSGLFKQDPVWLLNTRLTWLSADERWGINFWIKNATDERYLEGAVDLTDSNGTGALLLAFPRTIGLTASVRY